MQPDPAQPKQPTAALLITLIWISIMGLLWLMSLGLVVISITPADAPALYVGHVVFPVLLVSAIGFMMMGWRRRRPIWFLPAAFVSSLGVAAGIGAIVLDSAVNY